MHYAKSFYKNSWNCTKISTIHLEFLNFIEFQLIKQLIKLSKSVYILLIQSFQTSDLVDYTTSRFLRIFTCVYVLFLL